MPIFVVITDEPSPDIAKRLEEFHPLQIGATAYLVKSDALTGEIAEKAGIKGPNRDIGGGVVLGLDEKYSGYHRQDVWEWLRRNTD